MLLAAPFSLVSWKALGPGRGTRAAGGELIQRGTPQFVLLRIIPTKRLSEPNNSSTTSLSGYDGLEINTFY